MKTCQQILFLFLSVLTTAFAQNNIHRALLPGQPDEMLKQIQKSELYRLQESEDIKSLFLKAERSSGDMALRTQQGFFYEREGSDLGNTRTTVNKKLLDDGFLLIEGLSQNWDGSAWVNFEKYSYTYVPITSIDENSNAINSFHLSNNYPNPFNPSTKIKYSIPQLSQVQIKVFDV